MKTYFTYGAALAGTNALVTFALYFLGFHSELSKLPTASMIAAIVPLIASVVFIILGTRARSAETSPEVEFGYSSALTAGVMTTFFSSLIGAPVMFVYLKFINPEFLGLIRQSQIAFMEAQGESPAAIERAEKAMNFFSTPLMQTCVAAFVSMVIGTVIALIIAIFTKRQAVASEAALTPLS